MAKGPAQSARRGSKAHGVLSVTLSAIFWGFSGVCIQFLTDNCGVDGTWVTCTRLLFGGLIFMILACAIPANRRELGSILRPGKDLAVLVVYGALGVAACQLTYIMAIQYTNAGTGTILEQLGLIIVLAVTCISMRRWPRVREILGLVLAIAGTTCIVTGGDLSTIVLPKEGIIWGAASTISMACYILLPTELLKRYRSLSVIAPAMAMAAIMAILILRPWNCGVTVTGDIVLGIAGTVIFGTVGAYLLFLNGIRIVGPVMAGMLDCIEPAAAVFLSVICLATTVGPFDYLGCALIMGMMVLVTWEKPKKDDAK